MSEMTAREAAVDAVMTAYPEHKRTEYRRVGERAVRDIEAAGLAIVRATTPTDPAAGGELAALRRLIHAEVMAAIEAKAGTVLAPAVVVDAAVDAAAGMAAGADDSDFTDALARAYDHGRRDATPAAPGAATEGGDARSLVELLIADVDRGVSPTVLRERLANLRDDLTASPRPAEGS